MNPRKGYRENVAEQERRMIELEHNLEVVTRQRDELAEALRDLLLTSENADETGYVDGVGFIDIDAVREKARTALATKEGGV